MKVLISAYACEPGKGSEQGVGWNWAKQIARFHNVWVITRANNREVIEEELKNNANPNLHFCYLDLPLWMRFWKRGQRGLHLYYFLWQIAAYFTARKLHKYMKFDLAHHLTFSNIILPSFLSFLPIQFIWGPLGGLEKVPKSFRIYYGFKAKIIEGMRDVIQKLFFKINPLAIYNLRRAKLLILKTKETAQLIPKKFRNKILTIIHSGISDNEFYENSLIKNSYENFRIIFVGRLIHWKGCDFAIKSFAEFSKRNQKSELIIIGAGSDLKRLLKIKQKLNAKNIHFKGSLPRKETLKIMNDSDAFLFPSFKDAGPKVVFEALFLGLPIIYLDTNNLAEIITESCGIKVKAESPQQVISDLAKALELLASNEELRNGLSRAAKDRAIQFCWDQKGEIIKKYMIIA